MAYLKFIYVEELFMPFLTQEEYLERAKQVLAILAEKGIKLGQHDNSEEGQNINHALNSLRDVAKNKYRANLVTQQKMAEVILSYALTQLGFAACNEMAYRASLEYMDMFKDTNVRFIFGADTPTPPLKETHLFILIGNSEPVNSGEALQSYLRRQPDDCVMVDGFFGQCAVAKESYPIIQHYCEQYNIHQIIATPSFAASSSEKNDVLLGKLQGIRADGNLIADDIKQTLILAKLQKIEPGFIYNSKQKGFYVSGEEGYLNNLKAEFESAGIKGVQILRNASKVFLAIPESKVSVLPLIAMERSIMPEPTMGFAGPKK